MTPADGAGTGTDSERLVWPKRFLVRLLHVYFAINRGMTLGVRAACFDDAGRIFDALNWALREWPGMALATTGAKGSEKIAMRWSQQMGVTLILARAIGDAFTDKDVDANAVRAFLIEEGAAA